MKDQKAAEVLETLLDYLRCEPASVISKDDEQALTQAIARLEAGSGLVVASDNTCGLLKEGKCPVAKTWAGYPSISSIEQALNPVKEGDKI